MLFPSPVPLATSMKPKRELGTLDATTMGLGSILGTGVFVSIGIASGIAGPAVVAAVGLAGLVAICNALSSAQLAANHPVSGGTYEYGYRYLRPWIGFSAGWMFLCAKSASAATAAMGFAGYMLLMTGLPSNWIVGVALATVGLMTAVVLSGVRRSSQVNIAIVALTLVTLFAFVFVGCFQIRPSNLKLDWEPGNLLNATALMFVAFTGYGRIATLGEEVKNPRTTIPRAIIATLIASMFLYVTVAIVAVGAVGAGPLNAATSGESAPLEFAAREFPFHLAHFVSIGAITAMLGVLLNLVLGLSRVLFAMGRRRDMPTATANLNISVVATGVLIASLTLLGDVKTTWSFSAFTVLVYYSVTNLAALQIPPEQRLYPKFVSIAGLLGCLILAFAIDPQFWTFGLGVLAVGLLWYLARHRFLEPSS